MFYKSPHHHSLGVYPPWRFTLGDVVSLIALVIVVLVAFLSLEGFGRIKQDRIVANFNQAFLAQQPVEQSAVRADVCQTRYETTTAHYPDACQSQQRACPDDAAPDCPRSSAKRTWHPAGESG